MSGSVVVPGAAQSYPAQAYGTLGALIADSARASDQVATLTRQAGDGYVADTFAGLGAGAGTALSVRPVLAHQAAWQADIAASTGTLGVTQTALSGISTIASNFFAKTNTLDGLDPSNVDTVAASARAALAQVAGLLDSRNGSVYVLAGQDSTNPPVPDPDQISSSGFATQIAAAVQGLAANGSAATIAATLGIASSNAAGTSPFSAALSQSPASLAGLRSSVATGQGQSQQIGILASANATVASLGASTTGSYSRDILRALATLGSLSSAQVNTPGFSDVVGDVRTSLGDAITALNGDAGVAGDQQTQLQATSTQLGQTATALKAQLSGAEDVDMAKTLSDLSAAQTRLQASYQLIAGQQGLSLVKYLTGA